MPTAAWPPRAQVRCWTSLELLLALHNLPQQLRALKVRRHLACCGHECN
jgi:hypothetical protein